MQFEMFCNYSNSNKKVKFTIRYEKTKKIRCGVNWIEHIIEEEIKRKKKRNAMIFYKNLSIGNFSRTCTLEIN